VKLPADWDTEAGSGWWVLHHLVHPACGFRTAFAYDLHSSSGPFGEADARRVVYGHTCDDTQGKT
jgi:hypothetical protein